MNATEAAAILRRYNEWRLGRVRILNIEPAQITEALNVAIQVMEELGEPATGCNGLDSRLTDDQLNTIRREAFNAATEQKNGSKYKPWDYNIAKYPTADDYINSIKKEEQQ